MIKNKKLILLIFNTIYLYSMDKHEQKTKIIIIMNSTNKELQCSYPCATSPCLFSKVSIPPYNRCQIPMACINYEKVKFFILYEHEQKEWNHEIFLFRSKQLLISQVYI